MAEPNRYHICLSYEDEPRTWDLWDDGERNAPAYFREVLRVMEHLIGQRGLTIYLTWKLDELPSYGNDVVAVVMGDEWARYPNYASDVLATFKVYGTSPSLGGNFFTPPWPLKSTLALKYLRTCAHCIPGAMRRTVAGIRRFVKGPRPLPPVYPVPLGYGNQRALPVRPIEDRETDLFFAGSIDHGSSSSWSPQHWLKNPKTIARESMLRSLEHIKAKHNDWHMCVSTTASFTLNDLHYGTGEHDAILSQDVYSEVLMDTRLCLAPRGTSAETYRYFEGLRFGCVVLAEPQPKRWFYEGAPVVEISDWSRLPEVAQDLLSDTDRMHRLHLDALDWWENQCSEEAVGSYMAERVERLLSRDSTVSIDETSSRKRIVAQRNSDPK